MHNGLGSISNTEKRSRDVETGKEKERERREEKRDNINQQKLAT